MASFPAAATATMESIMTIKLELTREEVDRIYSALKYRSEANDPLVAKIERALRNK